MKTVAHKGCRPWLCRARNGHQDIPQTSALRVSAVAASVLVSLPLTIELVVASNPKKMLNLGAMVHTVVCVPAADQPHVDGNHQAKRRDCGKGWQPQAGGPTVGGAKPQNAGLLVEILHCDRAAGAHQIVPAMLQQRVHRNYQETTQGAQQN